MDPVTRYSPKLEYRYILLLIIGVVGVLLFAGFISTLWDNFHQQIDNKRLISIPTRLILLGGLCMVISRMHLRKFNGIWTINYSELRLLLFPLTIVGFGIAANWTLYSDAESVVFMQFAISVLLVGLLEEFLFRGMVLPLFIRSRIGNANSIHIAIIYSSILFGLMHYVNLFNDETSFWGVSTQVLFGFCLGIYLGALLLRTGNILMPAIIHALINFTFGTGDLRDNISHITAENSHFYSYIPTLIVFALIAYSGYYMLKRVDREQVLEKVRAIRIQD